MTPPCGGSTVCTAAAVAALYSELRAPGRLVGGTVPGNVGDTGIRGFKDKTGG